MKNNGTVQSLTHTPMKGWTGMFLLTGVSMLLLCGGCATPLEKVGRSNDQMYLVSVARNGKTPDVRTAAVAKLADQATLADFAKNDTDSGVRTAAADTLTDQRLLADVAKNAEDKQVRITAVIKLTDQNLLADVAKNDKDSNVRKAAAGKLDNQNLLVSIVKNDKDLGVRQEAVGKLTDQNHLVDFAKNFRDEQVRATAVKKIKNQSVVAEIAKTDGDINVCRVALQSLADQNVIADVAMCAENHSVRMDAVKLLKDPVLVDKVTQAALEEARLLEEKDWKTTADANNEDAWLGYIFRHWDGDRINDAVAQFQACEKNSSRPLTLSTFKSNIQTNPQIFNGSMTVVLDVKNNSQLSVSFTPVTQVKVYDRKTDEVKVEIQTMKSNTPGAFTVRSGDTIKTVCVAGAPSMWKGSQYSHYSGRGIVCAYVVPLSSKNADLSDRISNLIIIDADYNKKNTKVLTDPLETLKPAENPKEYKE